MPDKVTIKETKDGKYIEIFSWGSISSEEIQASVIRSLEIFEETGIARVLVDCRKLLKMPETFDAFSAAEHIVFQGMPLRFSLVINKKIQKEIVFMETVVVNRGGQAKFFFEWQEAYDWLMEKSSE